ncbi:hypothetical protein [Streptomyces sp. NPDC008137]|uniref:hypothetical protein n=1 Tax=Streptomyces sp. NPDC008137 TaxID=3364813 RepID=UPI0036E5C367
MDFNRRTAMAAGPGAVAAASGATTSAGGTADSAAGTTVSAATPATVTVTVQGEAAVRTNIPVRRDRRARSAQRSTITAKCRRPWR